jgi:hypothetical protein
MSLSFFFFLDFWTRKGVRERESKGPFYTPRPYTRALLHFFVLFLVVRALTNMGREAGGRLLTCFFCLLVD